VSRRSWTTLQNTDRARRAAGDKLERAEKTRLGHMLSSQPSFQIDEVVRRLDHRDELDRAQTEERLAKYQRLDLGDDDN
jgi:hypothetical protein